MDNAQLTPHMQRLVLTAPELADLTYQPGQDVMLMVAVDGNRPVRRRYTIRDLDPARQRLTMDIVRHGDGPGESWVHAGPARRHDRGHRPARQDLPCAGGGLAPVRRGRVRAGRGVRDDRLAARRRPRDRVPGDPRGRRRAEAGPPGRGQPDLAARATARPAGSTRRPWPRRCRRPSCPPAPATSTCSARPRWCWRCVRCSPPAACPGEQVSAKAYWGRGKANAQHGEPAREG